MTMTALFIILAILIFGLMIATHELGHFIVAKLCNVQVNEFAIGMGPKIFSKQWGETLYSLRCIPMGGFCAMEGEDDASDNPRAFTNCHPLKKACILAAGSLVNFITGLVIIAILYSSAAAFRAPIIEAFFENCPYEGENALMVGDRFHSIDGKRIFEYGDVSDFLAQGDGVYDFVLIRDGKKIRLDDFKMVPVEYETEEGIVKKFGFYFGYEEATLGVKLRNTWYTGLQFTRWVWQGLRELTGGGVKLDDLSGPVGVVELMTESGTNAQSTSDALFNIFYIAAFICINLSIMNMLPIPALDGGRVFLLVVTVIIQGITRKKLDPKYEGYIHAAGMILLLTLMGVIMFNDVLKIFKR